MASPSEMITLTSSDGEDFEVDKEMAKKFEAIEDLIEDVMLDTEIPLPNISGKTLSKVLEYCKKHYDADENNVKIPAEELKAWDDDFVKVDPNTLIHIMVAARFLGIKNNLLDLTRQTVNNMTKGKTPEQIRKTFNIENDFHPKEAEYIRTQYSWAFE